MVSLYSTGTAVPVRKKKNLRGDSSSTAKAAFVLYIQMGVKWGHGTLVGEDFVGIRDYRYVDVCVDSVEREHFISQQKDPGCT
jgi:hypothetical protein